MQRNDVAGYWNRIISNILRNWKINFQSDYTSLHSYQQCWSIPFDPHHCHHELSLEVLILAIPKGIRWNLRIILISIFLMMNISLSDSQTLEYFVNNSLSLYPGFNWVIWFVDIIFLEFLIYFINQQSVVWKFGEDLLPFFITPYCSIYSVLSFKEYFQFCEIPSINFLY